MQSKQYLNFCSFYSLSPSSVFLLIPISHRAIVGDPSAAVYSWHKTLPCALSLFFNILPLDLMALARNKPYEHNTHEQGC